jgi:tetraacyldisaccharide 4'-kinase
MMLARALPGVAVVVGASRYRAGRLAEDQLGATVHVLDDGFQHMQLARDVDLLVLSEDDLADAPMPAGRLREPVAAAAIADAAFVAANSPATADRVARAAGIDTVFRVTRALGTPHAISNRAEPLTVTSASKVFAVAGIARPERFFADLTAAGWHIVGEMRFPDHHRFTDRDVQRVVAAAHAVDAALVLTTDKDAVRLESHACGDIPIGAVPLIVGVEPADGFRDWLLGRVQGARAGVSARPGTRMQASRA